MCVRAFGMQQILLYPTRSSIKTVNIISQVLGQEYGEELS